MQATERINIRTTPHAKAMIELASQQMGVSMSHFILTTMYQKSLELLEKSEQVSEVWQIDNDFDKAVIQKLLDNPPPATPAMKELLQLTDEMADFTNAI